MKEIHKFEDFLEDIREAGMSMFGENAEGVFSLCSYFGDEIVWHTEDRETDPWEWRERALEECRDIAYGRFFFKKTGYITKEWFPRFYAVRRGRNTLEEEYAEGNISQYARQIYLLLEEHKELPVHLIKQYGGFGREDKAKFESALAQLQARFYVTMCGRARKRSGKGEEYGWSSTVYCLAENFFEREVMQEAEALDPKEAYEDIEAWIYKLNPDAVPRKVKKFIIG